MNLHDVVSSIDVPMTNYNAISYSRGIARLMKLQEKDLHCLLRGTRLTVDRFIYDDIPISDSDELQIFKSVLSTTNDPSFGLQLGAQLSPESHGSMGFLADSSPTLRGAIDDFIPITVINFPRQSNPACIDLRPFIITNKAVPGPTTLLNNIFIAFETPIS